MGEMAWFDRLRDFREAVERGDPGVASMPVHAALLARSPVRGGGIFGLIAGVVEARRAREEGVYCAVWSELSSIAARPLLVFQLELDPRSLAASLTTPMRAAFYGSMEPGECCGVLRDGGWLWPCWPPRRGGRGDPKPS